MHRCRRTFLQGSCALARTSSKHGYTIHVPFAGLWANDATRRQPDSESVRLLALPGCHEPFHLYHPFALQTLPQASALFAAFPLRERLILKLCGLAGLRPGEALALQWHDLRPDGLHISRRVYRGKLFGLKLER
jgi:integrase